MSTDLVPDLTDAECGALVEHERTIERGLKTFVEVGRALAAIRDGRLYRTEYATFEAYCDQRWAISRPRAYQLIEAAEVVSTTVDTGYRPPANEAQARELGRVSYDDRRDVWREANERSNGRPTAATIRDVVRERQGPPPPPDPLPADVAEQIEARIAERAREEVAEAIATNLPPDDPWRGWRASYLRDIAAAYKVLSLQTPDEVAERADDECIDEFRRLVRELNNYADRLTKAITANYGGNVVAFRSAQ